MRVERRLAGIPDKPVEERLLLAAGQVNYDRHLQMLASKVLEEARKGQLLV